MPRQAKPKASASTTTSAPAKSSSTKKTASKKKVASKLEKIEEILLSKGEYDIVKMKISTDINRTQSESKVSGNDIISINGK